MDQIAEAIEAAMPDLDSTDQHIASAIHRLMSRGEPVEPEAVAHAAGAPVQRVQARLESWPGVYRDDRGRVVGFWGHAISKLEPEYRFLIDGKTTYAWCALDTLFIPALVGKAVRVEASDPNTGEPISLVVDAGGVHGVRPAGSVVSMVIPDGAFGYDVIESFCHRVLLFASEASGVRWVAEHDGTILLSVKEAFEIGRRLTERIAPDLSSEGSRQERQS
jgi:alkylmercury lyase